MKKMLFVIGGIGSARKPVFEKLYNTCKFISNDSVSTCMIGNFEFNDALKNVDKKWADYCVNQIKTHLEMFTEKDYYIFTGSILCMYIDILVKHYPDAGVYLVRKTDENLFQDASLMLSKFNVTDSEIKDFNKAVTDSMDRLVEEHQLEWKSIDSPVFTDSLIPNFIEGESKLKIQMSTYNI